AWIPCLAWHTAPHQTPTEGGLSCQLLPLERVIGGASLCAIEICVRLLCGTSHSIKMLSEDAKRDLEHKLDAPFDPTPEELHEEEEEVLREKAQNLFQPQHKKRTRGDFQR
ncbi:unnamed protein product, partial [Ectocarpus sp. 8 AP-2014]